MRVTRILHAAVNVDGRFPETRDFYSSVLELSSTPRPDFGFPGEWLVVGDSEDRSQIHLIDYPGRDALAIDPRAAHLCLGVADLDAAIAELEARSIPYVRSGEGARTQVWFADPSGFVLEIQHDPHG